MAVHLTDLEVKTSLNPYASDHVPFIEKGFPAFLTIEGSDSSNKDIHTERDKLSLIDYTLMSKIIQVNTAFAHKYLEL
jgi:Zn-dependent M28 family amino/carboxypeptidase